MHAPVLVGSVVEEHVAVDAADSHRAQPPRPAAKDRQRIAVVVTAREVGVAGAEHRQVADQGVAAQGAAQQQRRLEEVARPQQLERRRGGEELGVRGDGERAVGVEGDHLLARLQVHQMDAELCGLRTRPADRLGEGLAERPAGGAPGDAEAGGESKRNRDEGSSVAHRPLGVYRPLSFR